MANRWAVKSGAESDDSVWNGGTPLLATDDVYADGWTVSLTRNLTVASLRTSQRSGGTAGGGFTVAAGGVTITAAVTAGTTACLRCSHDTGTVAVSGNVTGGSAASAYGVSHTGGGTVTIGGNVAGGTSAGHGVVNSGAGTINISGSASGGGVTTYATSNTGVGSINITGAVAPGGNNFTYGLYNDVGTCSITGAVTGSAGSAGVWNAGSGTITITGSPTSGSAYPGVVNNAGGTINIVGNPTGGVVYCVHNAGAGTINVTGNPTGGSATAAYGVYNAAAGVVNVTGNPTPGTAAGAHGVYSVSTGHVRLNGNQLASVTGSATGTLGLSTRLLAVSSPTTRTAQVPGAGAAAPNYDGSLYTLYGSQAVGNSGGQASTADVRLNTVYGPTSELRGTCAVPPRESVANGVPVDATTGNAILTQAAAQAASQAAITASLLPTAQQVWEYVTRTTTAGGLTPAEAQAAAAAAITAAGLVPPRGQYLQSVTVLDQDEQLIQGATCQIFSGSTRIDYRISDATGAAPLACDAGTYQLLVALPGLYQSSVQDLVVTAAGSITVHLTPIAISPPTVATDCRVAWLCLDDSDAASAGVVIRAVPDTDATSTGVAWSGRVREATSGVDGMATLDLPQGSTWTVWRESGEAVSYTVPATSTAYGGSLRGGRRDAI